MSLYKFTIVTDVEEKRRDEIISAIRNDFPKFYGHSFNSKSMLTEFYFKNDVCDGLTECFIDEAAEEQRLGLIGWFKTKYKTNIVEGKYEAWV